MRIKTVLNFSKVGVLAIIAFLVLVSPSNAWKDAERQKQEIEINSKQFEWWPTNALPAPVKDEKEGGYWWWPKQPEQAAKQDLWGNRGFIYVAKIIYDYKEQDSYDDELTAPVTPPVSAPEPRPSLLVKKIIKNIKIYFDYNKADLQDDHTPILMDAVKALKRNPEAAILITGNCDARGSSEYNMKLGNKRGAVVQDFMLEQGVSEDRVKIISRGKLDAISSVTDLAGMAKDRNAQFMVAEVEEIMMAPEQVANYKEAVMVDEGKYVVEDQEQVESQAQQVETREYVVQKNDSFWKIAAKELGNGNRWEYLYELNKDRVKNAKSLKVGQILILPVE